MYRPVWTGRCELTELCGTGPLLAGCQGGWPPSNDIMICQDKEPRKRLPLSCKISSSQNLQRGPRPTQGPPAWHRYRYHQTQLQIPTTYEAVTGASRSNQSNEPQIHAPPLLPPPLWLPPRRLEPPPKLAPLAPFRTACGSQAAPAGGMPGQDCLMLGGPAAPA